MITIRFAGWVSDRIVSLQPDTDIHKRLSNGNRIRISETLFSIFRGFKFLEKVTYCIIIIIINQKHLFSLLCHDYESACGVITVP